MTSQVVRRTTVLIYGCFTLALSAISNLAFSADRLPSLEPGPIIELSKDAYEISRILIDGSVAECVSQWRNSRFEIRLNSIRRQALQPGTTRYYLEGIALKEGDVAVGTATMTILEVTNMAESKDLGARSLSCTVDLP